MKKLLLLFTMSLLAWVGYGQPYTIDLGKTNPGVNVVENNAQKLVLTFNYGGINYADINTQKGVFSQIDIPGAYRTGEVGNPQLPASRKLVQIPAGAHVSVKVLSFETNEYNLADYGIKNKILPYQPSYPKSIDPSQMEFKYNENSYSTKGYNQSELASVFTLGKMRGIELAQVEVNPVLYNPSKNTIKVYNNIKVEVTFTGGDNAKTKSLLAKTYSPYFETLYKNIVNYSSGAKDNFTDNPDHTKYPVKYLIVTNPMFVDQLEDFIDWKTKKGFEVIMATTDETGTTAAGIKAWIHGQYNAGTETDPAPTFFLLVGDTPQLVASQTGTATSKQTDLYYACVDGASDIFPDMYYGRLSATDSSQLQVQLDKIMYYEQYQFEDDTYLNHVTLIAGADGTWNPNVGQPTINYGTTNYFNAEHGYTNVNAYLSSYSGCYAADKISVGFINYTAHCGETSWGDPVLTQGAVNAFTNQNKYPLAVGNCCLAADFGYSGSECIGETWMRKANGGSVAYIGSSPSSYWYEDFYWSVGAHSYSAGNYPSPENSTLGAYDAPYNSDYLCVDALIFVGNLAVAEAFSNSYPTSISLKYYWEAYNCLSDPSIFIYHTQGIENTVNHLPTLPIGMNEYEVSAEPGSYVAISKDGILHGAALVPESGVVSVPIEPVTSGGDVDIVVTKYQYKPYQAVVTAAALEGPYLTVNAININDEITKGNQQADYGEVFNIDLTIENVGAEIAQGITANITTQSDYVVSFTNNVNVPFNNIEPEALETSSGMFLMQLEQQIPDQTVISLNITLTDNSTKKTYESVKSFKVNAPKLSVKNIYIDDTQLGDANNILDPGETASLKVVVENTGKAPISANVNVGFEVGSSSLMSLIDQNAEAGVIEPGQLVTLSFGVSANADVAMGTPEDLVIDVVTDYEIYNQQTDYELIIGLIPEFTMSNETVTTSVGLFYDSGGSNAPYSASENYTMTFKPTMAGKLIMVDFLSFETEANSSGGCYDPLSIYDGPDATGQLLGSFCGATNPGTFMASTSSGALTFKFTSDGSVQKPGWAAQISTVDAVEVKFIVTDGVEPIAGATVSFNNDSETTNTNGEVSFIYIDTKETLSYSVSAIGYYDYEGELVVNTDDIIENVTLIIKPRYTITFDVASAGLPVSGAQVNFNNQTKTTDVNGIAVFTDVIENTNLAYSISKTNYVTTQDVVDADADKTVNAVLTDDILTPQISSVENMREGKAKMIWGAVAAPTFEDSFETYSNWATTFGEYTLIDVDGLSTFGAEDYDFDGENAAMAFKIMNSTATTPAWPTLAAHTGDKIAASFSANSGSTPNTAENNDWIITPQLTIGNNFEFAFWVKSVTAQYGLERFKVGISTTNTQTSSFTIISSGAYLEAPADWTRFAFNLSAYQGQNVYLAIQCVSADAFVFMLDDLSCKPATGKSEKLFEGYAVYLDNMETPVATGIDAEEYTFTGLVNGQTYTVGLQGIYSTGQSEIITYQFTYNQVYTVSFHTTIDNVDQAGVNVQFNDTDKTTDVNGLASFDIESEMAVNYNVSFDGYYSQNGTIDVIEDKNIDIELIFIPDVTFEVKDENDVAIENAEVTFNNQTKYTGVDGKATFTDIYSQTDMEYSVKLTGYMPVTSQLTVAGSDIVQPVVIHSLANITFVVKDPDGLVVVDARVRFNSAILRTNANGIAVFENVMPAIKMPYRVTMLDYLDVNDTIDVTFESKIINVVINPISDVTFTVIQNGAVIPGITVTLDQTSVVTNQEGKALFENVISGNHVYVIESDGNYTVTDTVTVAFDDVDISIELQAIPDVTFAVSANNESIENAKVTLGDAVKYTNQNGQAQFIDIPAGEYNYTVELDGYYIVNKTIIVETDDINQQVELQIIPDVTIIVTSNQIAIPGAKVTLNNVTKIANTEGTAIFTNVAKGKYAIVIEKLLYNTYSDSIVIGDTDVSETIEILLTTYAANFTITDGQEPVEGALVTINGVSKQTSAQGKVTIDGLPIADNYTYNVTKDGYFAKEGFIDIVDDDVNVNTELILITYIVTFNVTDKVSEVAGASITFNNQTKNTNINGIAEFAGVAPATGLAYSVENAAYHKAVSGTVDVDSNETVNILLNQTSITGADKNVFSIYPNPTNGVVNIMFNNNAQKWSVIVIDESSRTVKQIPAASMFNTIDLTDKAKGTYYIKFVSGSSQIVEKVVLY